jgi:hypothetical protein
MTTECITKPDKEFEQQLPSAATTIFGGDQLSRYRRKRQWSKLVHYALHESKIIFAGESFQSMPDSDYLKVVSYDNMEQQIRKYNDTIQEIATRALEDIDYEDISESKLSASRYIYGPMTIEQSRITTIGTVDGRLEPTLIIIRTVSTSGYKSLGQGLNPQSEQRKERFVRKTKKRLGGDIKDGNYLLEIHIMPMLPEKIDNCVVVKGSNGQIYYGDKESGVTFNYTEARYTDEAYVHLGAQLTPKDDEMTTRTMQELASIAEIISLSEKA